jgi:uncharacterized RDD family membrane protein YckC
MSTTPPDDLLPPPDPVPQQYPAAPEAPPLPSYPTTLSALPVSPSPAPVAGWARPGPAPGLAYAGFGARFAGYLLDTLLITAVEAVVTVPLVFVPIVQFYRDHPVVSGQSVPPLPTELTTRFAILGLFGALVSALYFGGLVAWQGRTVGQRAAGTRVVREEDGGKLPAGRAFLRAVVFWGPGVLSPVPSIGGFAGLIAFLMLLSVAWDPRKQGWHDKLGKALVVKPIPQARWMA